MMGLDKATAELFHLAKAARTATTPADRGRHKIALREAGGLLGLLQQDPGDWLGSKRGNDVEAARIERLVDAREAARSSKNFADADRIRNELDALGVVVEDRANGPVWRRTRGTA